MTAATTEVLAELRADLDERIAQAAIAVEEAVAKLAAAAAARSLAAVRHTGLTEGLAVLRSRYGGTMLGSETAKSLGISSVLTDTLEDFERLKKVAHNEFRGAERDLDNRRIALADLQKAAAQLASLGSRPADEA